MTWNDAELLFPECSACWDRDATGVPATSIMVSRDGSVLWVDDCHGRWGYSNVLPRWIESPGSEDVVFGHEMSTAHHSDRLVHPFARNRRCTVSVVDNDSVRVTMLLDRIRGT